MADKKPEIHGRLTMENYQWLLHLADEHSTRAGTCSIATALNILIAEHRELKSGTGMGRRAYAKPPNRVM